MKYDNSDLCHLFASRTETRGTGSNLFFEHDKMYSYGYHFLLAEYLDADTILINDRYYSSSTAKHQSLIRQATRQYKQYFTRGVDLDLVHSQVMDLSKKILTARKKDIIASKILDLYASCTEFNIKYKVGALTDPKYHEIQDIYKSIAVNKDEYIAAAKAREAKELEALRLKLKGDVRKFMNHEIDRIDSRKLNVDFIRLSLDLKNVETSQGVKVPLKDAAYLYKMIQANMDINGVAIGGYPVTGLNGVLSVGCHRIDVDNMHEIGELILST